MRFTIKGKNGGKPYDAADLDQVTLRDILLFEKQTRDMGREVTWAQVEQWNDEMGKMKTDTERSRHSGAPWLTGITVWASRRLAGEDIDFSDAVDFPMRDITFLPETQDRKAPTKPRPAAKRAGSGRGAKTGPRATSAAPATSERASTSG